MVLKIHSLLLTTEDFSDSEHYYTLCPKKHVTTFLQ